MLTTAASYRLIAGDLARSLKNTAADPVVAREVEYYRAHIGAVRSIDDLIGDDRLFRFAMTAFGLGEMSYAKAYMRKALSEGVDDREAFVNQLADSRYKDFVSTFNFARYGEATSAFDRTQQGTIDRYLRQTLEVGAGAQNEGVRLALYFSRKAETIDSAYDILADPALLSTVRIGLGLPLAAFSGDIDKQAEMIDRRLDIAALRTEEGLADFLERFTSLYELERQSPSAPNALLPTGSGLASFSADILSALQSFKPGGR